MTRTELHQQLTAQGLGGELEKLLQYSRDGMRILLLSGKTKLSHLIK